MEVKNCKYVNFSDLVPKEEKWIYDFFGIESDLNEVDNNFDQKILILHSDFVEELNLIETNNDEEDKIIGIIESQTIKLDSDVYIDLSH